MSLVRALAAEFLGTLLLLAVVVGSGIMGERLAPSFIAAQFVGAGLAVLVARLLMPTKIQRAIQSDASRYLSPK